MCAHYLHTKVTALVFGKRIELFYARIVPSLLLINVMYIFVISSRE